MRPGFSPLDDELELLPGHLTPSLAEQLVRLGAWLPFEPAARMLGYFSKVTVSAATARRRAEQAGAAYEAVRTAEVARLERELPLAPTGPALQQLSVDGAMVPLTGKRWGEVKLLAIGTVEAPVWGDDEWRVHASAVSYFGRMTDAETFGRLATVETHRRGTERAGRVCAGVDGAEWQQGFIDLHRPDAVRILDFPHAGEYVARAGQAVFGAGTDAMTEWLAEHLHALKHGAEATVLRVLAELRQRVAREGTPEALAVVATSLTYLEKRREQLRYAEFQAHGYPIGSGMLESGNKLVTEARLKGAGMHGAPAHVNPMIALRTLVCADRWDEGWALISTRLRAEALARTPTRRVEPPPQPPAALDSSVTPLAPTLPAGAAAQPPPVVAVGPTSPRVLTPTAAPEQRARPAAPAPPPTSRRPSTHHPWRRPLIPPDRRQPLAS